MSDVATLIADMVRAGVDPDLIGRTASLLAEQSCRGDEQAERRRASDRERKRNARLRNSADSADTPLPPALDKEKSPAPPKEIKPTPLTPQTTPLSASGAGDLDRLSERLVEAAGGKMHPHSAIVVGPILELMSQGVDLETDILPAISAASQRLGRTVNLAYFLGPIRDAHSRRVEAGKGIAVPKPSTLKRDEDRAPEELREQWRKRLDFARPREEWLTWIWGPPPGKPGCRVPSEVITEADMSHNWREQMQSEAA